MCTSPISVRRTVAGRCIERVVPCGKCEECRSKQRNEVALLTLLESDRYDSFEYITLTYRQTELPLAISSAEVFFDEDGTKYEIRNITGYDRGRDFKRVDEYKECCKPIDYDSYSVCPTLYTQDWKEHMHRFRAACSRAGLSKDFSFIQFGEYGTKHQRPHYHAIFFGFTPEHVHLFESLWLKYYGESRTFHVPRFNEDGSNAFVKVSNYISKYVSKGDLLPVHVMNGYAHRPRRLSSIRYGRKDLDLEKLRNFTLERMLNTSHPKTA